MLYVCPTKSIMRDCPSLKKVQNIRLGQIRELDCFSFAEMVVIVSWLWCHPCSTSHLSLLVTPVYFRRRRCSMTSLLSGSLSSSTTSVASLFLRRSDLTRLAGLRMLRNLPTRTTVKAPVSRDSLRAVWFSSAGHTHDSPFSLAHNIARHPARTFFRSYPAGISFSVTSQLIPLTNICVPQNLTVAVSTV